VIVNAFAIVGLTYFVLHFLTSFRFTTLFTVADRQVDFRFWYYVPRYIVEHLRYPASETGDWTHVIFQYLPSAAAMLLPLSAIPHAISLAIWLLAQAVAFAFVIWAAARLSGAAALPGWPSIALVAALLTSNALGWDFRNHNNNLIYLALVMMALLTNRTWLSAVLIAISVNLKLYSGLLLIALAWRREYRLAAATAIACALLALVLPLAVFGPAALPQLAADWLEQIRYTTSAAHQAAGPASLFLTASALLGADITSQAVAVLVRATQGCWMILVIGYFVTAGRSQPTDREVYNQVRLADACVALMAPLPLSTWFLPYHGVVMLPAFVLLITAMVAPGSPNRTRAAALIGCVGSQLVRLGGSWNFRGAAFLAGFVVLVLALAVIRQSLMQARVASVRQDSLESFRFAPGSQ
jgi:glycosyl transferase family 87